MNNLFEHYRSKKIQTHKFQLTSMQLLLLKSTPALKSSPLIVTEFNSLKMPHCGSTELPGAVVLTHSKGKTHPKIRLIEMLFIQHCTAQSFRSQKYTEILIDIYLSITVRSWTRMTAKCRCSNGNDKHTLKWFTNSALFLKTVAEEQSDTLLNIS